MKERKLFCSGKISTHPETPLWLQLNNTFVLPFTDRDRCLLFWGTEQLLSAGPGEGAAIQGLIEVISLETVELVRASHSARTRWILSNHTRPSFTYRRLLKSSQPGGALVMFSRSISVINLIRSYYSHCRYKKSKLQKLNELFEVTVFVSFKAKGRPADSNLMLSQWQRKGRAS